MERKHSLAVAQALNRPVSQVRQMLRALREAGLVPGITGKPMSVHIARIVMALGADLTKDVAPTVSALRTLPLWTSSALPATAEGMLVKLIDVLPFSPVVGDDLDVDDGFIHLAADTVSLECLTVAGHRVVIRYGAPFTGIAHRVTVPVNTIRTLISNIRNVT